jgi:citrate lyase subunit gamma (acyl carrier protein)
MEATTESYAGSMESGDVFVRIKPNVGTGIVLELKSTVERQFGDQIKGVTLATLEKLEMKNLRISLDDRGALNPVIEARVMAAAYRSAQSKDFNWRN